jgi:uncharacterized protein YdhG (YjbR/CyaY superfamily)
MNIEAENPDEYIRKVPEERTEAMKKLRKVIKENLPEGFEETMNYGMIGYVVPHSIYPDGYHVNPELPLSFIHIASQKNHISVYHSGIYADDKLMKWFTNEYPKYVKTKLDMGKSCIRFRNPDHIPFDLIGELAGKVTVKEWIKLYKKNLKR